MCMLRDCSVCECPEDEVPTSWRDEEGSCACECGLAVGQQEQHALCRWLAVHMLDC